MWLKTTWSLTFWQSKAWCSKSNSNLTVGRCSTVCFSNVLIWWWLHHTVTRGFIGAGSGRAAAPTGDILTPPGRLLPPQTFILGHNSQGMLVSGSKRRSKSGEDLFFLENADFWDRKQSLCHEEPILAMQTLAPLVLPPLPVPYNSSRATARLSYIAS